VVITTTARPDLCVVRQGAAIDSAAAAA